VLTIGLATLTFATASQAQRTKGTQATAKTADRISVIDRRTTGFVLGVSTVGATGLTIGTTEGIGALTTGFGPGAGVMVGYGFNRTFSAFASADVAKQPTSSDGIEGNFGLTHLEVGGRANLPFGDGATVPYVTGSLGRRALSARGVVPEADVEVEVKFSGTMFGIGGGVEHSFSSTLAMDGGLELGFGRFNNVQINEFKRTIEVDGSTSVRLRVGVTWRPARRPS
jgi:hypothetical protein